ncbi:50S ribosomal protein L9 [Gemmatimonadota bacterium]
MVGTSFCPRGLPSRPARPTSAALRTRRPKRRASQLEGMALTFHARAGEDGKLFGSVTAGDISDRANEQGLDFQIERRQVIMEEPLKTVGASQVTVRLYSEVEVEIEVRVEREEG